MRIKEISNEFDRRIKKLEETIIAIEPINNNKILNIVDALNNAFKEIGNISIRLTNIEKENKQSNCEIVKDYSITAIINGIYNISQEFRKRIENLKSKNDELEKELEEYKEKLCAINELLKGEE